MWSLLDVLELVNGGEGGIRTPGTGKGTSDFESGAFNRALPPLHAVLTAGCKLYLTPTEVGCSMRLRPGRGGEGLEMREGFRETQMFRLRTS